MMTTLTSTHTVNENPSSVTIELVAENALLLTWPEVICFQQHQVMMALEQSVKKKYHESILESIVSYNSLLIYYRFDKLRTNNLIDFVKALLSSNSDASSNDNETSTATYVEIPVYYGAEVGLDLTQISHQTKLSVAEIIALHSQTSYRAYALGFTPGFCYLAGVNRKLWLPRLSSPRKSVPVGAVAIAEQQTAVYPSQSPGGWHIIGRTPTPMFSFEGGDFQPLINVGDEIKFTPIDKTTFIELGGKIANEYD